MIAKALRRGAACLAMSALLWTGTTLTQQPVLAQQAAEPSLDTLFDEALQGVTLIEKPRERIWAAEALAELDYEYGGARLGDPLLAIMRKALPALLNDEHKLSDSYSAGVFIEMQARYGRNSEAVAAMMASEDSGYESPGVLEILATNGELTNAMIIAMRVVRDHQRAYAMLHVVNALREAGESDQAFKILVNVARLISKITEVSDQQGVAGEYVAALAYFDAKAAEKTAFSVKGWLRDMYLEDLVGAYAELDPKRGLKLAAKIKSELQRQWAFDSLLRATARDPDQQQIYKKALKKAPRDSRAEALTREAEWAIEGGDLERARSRLDAVDALLPKLADFERNYYLRNAAMRLSVRALAGDPEIVFGEIDNLPYGHGFDRPVAVRIIARDLRRNGHDAPARRLNETIRGDINYAYYFTGAIRDRLGE